jgi:toxin ParE1/3/4
MKFGPRFVPVIPMSGFKLSVEAAGDLVAIGEYGMKTFGFAQSLKYHLALESRFELLAQFPRIGMPSYDLLSGLYRFPYQAHMIFFTIEPDHIYIVRVLHANADFKRHFNYLQN